MSPAADIMGWKGGVMVWPNSEQIAAAPTNADHIITLLPKRVLAEPHWRDMLSDVDRRALTPPFCSNANLHGQFPLDMERHLDLELAPAGLSGGPPLPAAAG